MKKGKWHKVRDGQWLNFEHISVMWMEPTQTIPVQYRVMVRDSSGGDHSMGWFKDQVEADALIKELMRRYGD